MILFEKLNGNFKCATLNNIIFLIDSKNISKVWERMVNSSCWLSGWAFYMPECPQSKWAKLFRVRRQYPCSNVITSHFPLSGKSRKSARVELRGCLSWLFVFEDKFSKFDSRVSPSPPLEQKCFSKFDSSVSASEQKCFSKFDSRVSALEQKWRPWL
jgi:hypothetical protein